MAHDRSRVITTLDARSYFHDCVTGSLVRQHVRVGETTLAYLVNLLLAFMDARQLLSQSEEGLEIRPLAFRYADALQADGVQQRNLALRKLGDVALFVAGMFAGSFTRRLVDVDYYIAMGGAAYRELHEQLEGHFEAGGGPFGELGAKFPALVDVLAEVSEESHLGAQDLLRNYEIWLRTGSERALRALERLGVHPSPHAVSLARH